MNTQAIHTVLLDIEGTTSSISFVYDVMFPYVRQHLSRFLQQNWQHDSVQACLPLLAQDLGRNPQDWPTGTAQEQQQLVGEAVIQLMDDDVKATGLKQLQGLIWEDGFTSGQLVAHLYDDVPLAITRWRQQGIEVRIYSSGSISAQQLFFGHTVAGDLLAQLSGHYDTTTGPKREPTSFAAIAKDIGQTPEGVLFVSDVVEELDAAAAVGMQTALSLRPGNKPIEAEHNHRSVTSFEQLF